ncbi:MAG: DUF4405 domain-containing protein [Deltaproteobacteria bacterium]|nr:DUF4405 domain-containing protein [Deltaproteobacteria bacterium]
MSYIIIGEIFHEWNGIVLLLLFIFHNILNKQWYKILFKGKYNALRIIQTVVIILIIVFFIILMTSGLILSRHIFKFINISGFTVLSRSLHLLAAYWFFLFISVHLGLHSNKIIMKINKLYRLKYTKKTILYLIRGFYVSASLYGLYAFLKHNYLDYILFRTQFIYFDLNISKLLFFLDYLAIMSMVTLLFFCIKFILTIFRNKLKYYKRKILFIQ